MGYGTRNNGQITTYSPDNTPKEFYWQTEYPTPLSNAIAAAAEHFGISTYECATKCQIEGRHIHTDCLYYDGYDSSDWTNYLCFTYTRQD